MDKIPPQNLDAEKSLIGSILATPEMFDVITGVVTAEMFYRSKHQSIYSAIDSLWRNGEPIDIISISAELDKMKVKHSRSELLDFSMPTGMNAEHYAELVAERYVRRQAINAIRESEILAFDDSVDIIDTITTIQKNLEITMPNKLSGSSIHPEADEIIKAIIDGHEKGIVPYLATGFTKLDKHTKLRAGELTMIAADAGEGKTSLMLSVARNVIKQGKRPLYVTLEMTRQAIIENLIAQELGICHQDMIGYCLPDAELARLIEGIGKIRSRDMGVVDGSWDTSKIRHLVITEMRKSGIDCLFVDSLGKVKHNSKSDRESVAYNEICGDLVNIGVEFNIPVVVAHHLNKNDGYRGKNSRPTIKSLNEAGDRWTHNVLLLYREFRYTQNKELEGVGEVIVAKARDGKEGIVTLKWNGPSKTFFNLADERTENIAKTIAK